MNRLRLATRSRITNAIRQVKERTFANRLALSTARDQCLLQIGLTASQDGLVPMFCSVQYHFRMKFRYRCTPCGCKEAREGSHEQGRRDQQRPFAYQNKKPETSALGRSLLPTLDGPGTAVESIALMSPFRQTLCRQHSEPLPTPKQTMIGIRQAMSL